MATVVQNPIGPTAPSAPKLATLGMTGMLYVGIAAIVVISKLVEFGYGAADKELPTPGGVNVVALINSVGFLVMIVLAMIRGRSMLVPGSSGVALTIAIPLLIVYFFDQIVNIAFKKQKAAEDEPEVEPEDESDED